MDDDLLYFNGIDATSGSYVTPPLKPDEVVQLARTARFNKKQEHFKDLQRRAAQEQIKHLGVAANVDPNNLASSGWGVIFPYDVDPAIREALSELLNHRKYQATRHNEQFYREFIGPDAYRNGETKSDFLKRFGIGPDGVDPEKGVPYYLLIVADPQTIPYRFQYELDVQFSVGRIHFDSVEDYAYYARSVVEAESGRFVLPKRAVFFAPRNPDDRATALSADDLVTPLVAELQEETTAWTIESLIGENNATKANLSQLLNGSNAPALLFTASHGAVFPKGDPRQLTDQGALICQDWQGPYQHRGELTPNLYFAAQDLAPSTNLLGMIGFFFACYGGGTPQLDAFAYRETAYQPHGVPREQETIAPHAFLAQLPKQLLANRGGGALAIVGHVDRAWGYSFKWHHRQQQIGSFVSTLVEVMQGKLLGEAMEYFNERYATIATELNNLLEYLEFSRKVDPYDLSRLWTANNDARNYTIIGDPAVRLPVHSDAAISNTRPDIGEVRVASLDPSNPTVAIPAAVSDVFAAVKGKDDTLDAFPANDEATHPSKFTAAVASIVQKAAQAANTHQSATPTPQPPEPPPESFDVGQQPESKTATLPTIPLDATAGDGDAAIAQLYARWQAARAAEEKVRARTEEYLHQLQAALHKRYNL